MSIIDTLLAWLAPYDCLQCGQEGSLLCQRCTTRLLPARSTCWRCDKPKPRGRTCEACWSLTALSQVQAAYAYKGPVKQYIWKFKFDGARAAARAMALPMAQLVEADRSYLIVPVPTGRSRARQRGYDQAKLLARALARASDLTYMDPLRRNSHSHQVGAGREQRFRQLDGVFRINQPQRVAGGHILLVDDVLTTGATLQSAAEALRAAGASSITALTFARA